MRPGLMLAAVAALAAAASPAVAEPRWLACKFTDQNGAEHAFDMVFDDIRNTAALFEAGTMVEGTRTSITFQSLRTRFPKFTAIYNRNDGALAITAVAGTYGGTFVGACRRSLPPPGAPQG
jgi:hypothetical protein